MPLGLGDDADQSGSGSPSDKPAGTLAASDPPNLTGTVLARSDPRPRLDVTMLDTLHTPSHDDDA